MAFRKYPTVTVILLTHVQQIFGLVLAASSTFTTFGATQSPSSIDRGFLHVVESTYYPTYASAPDLTPDTTGIVISSLETEGRARIIPFPTPTLSQQAITAAFFAANVSASLKSSLAGSLDPLGPSNTTTTFLSVKPTSMAENERLVKLDARAATDCFQPLPTSSLPPQISSRSDHLATKLGINQNGPISTNKFYANLFLGNQNQGVWTHPYSLTWSKGGGNLRSWGMAVSHIDADQRAYGPPNVLIPGYPTQYFINPIGIQSIILSAIEIGDSSVLTTSSLTAFSVSAVLAPQAQSTSSITFPLVQGMGFVTAVYQDLMPVIQSAVFFRSLVPAQQPKPGVFKYRITLEDSKTWLVYVTPSSGQDPGFQLVSNTQVQGMKGWSGTIQVAKNPSGALSETIYDTAAGTYPSSGMVTATVSATTGTYQLKWTKAGLTTKQPLLMFALPHHVSSFDSITATLKTSLHLQTTTKGLATGVLADSWTLVETSLPTDIAFAPWTPSKRSKTSVSSYSKSIIKQVAAAELSQNIGAQTYLDSMYFSGKALSKFAMVVYSTRILLGDITLAAQGLKQLKDAFAKFVANKQIYPLVYDSKWGGIVSSATYKTKDAGQDFGNTFYNDHHFHYGYFIHTAAVIAYLDPGWASSNALWVNTLIRDVASPSSNDPQFPFSRMFDWYHGHSFAKGLFESADSKDEESTSEDAFFAYALKMWGIVTKSQSMEARGNLMLAILARTFDNYFLMKQSNINQPSNFIGNKVTGIVSPNRWTFYDIKA
ncbi:uncharacterized protein KY384_004360 [Bacidia gigantensis]|uniref:uncharacterized protein n=1 Tax=Bacidia gigantensis TaxID=2732470 RepID=UPI001D058DA6|nr:uncharacterized protein KY384_004360 [Bacidia gigantensis]KAG8531003.1 hypothetical protein KY384_004360 [Bacidia gigantensis]